ncbi:high mobility group protein B1-like, partial [Anneissia japonica]|uniref:high mobility group protein B1-like n=1 Tax=Anneissia japonica TaxID=1529436 RepID=UPI001425AB7F
SAFFLYSQDERAGVRGKHPDWNVALVAKELADMWKKITPAQKAVYEKSAAKEKERYLKQMEAYKKSLKSPGQQKMQQQQKAPKGAKKQKKEESSSDDEDESSSSEEASSSEESDEE